MTHREQPRPGTAMRVRRGAIAIIEEDKRLLMVLRAPGVVRAGHWCFPGGHLEPGETSRQAIRREMAEELGIEVVPFERVGSVRTSDGKYVLAVWRVRRMSDKLKVAEEEVAEVEWLTPGQIRAIAPNLQSNLQVLNMLGV